MKYTLSLLFLFFIFSVSAAPGQDKIGDQRIYILPEQVEISPKGMRVHLGNRWLPINALLSDEEGLYIHNLWPKENGCPKDYWPCRNCDRCVKFYYDICPSCGKPV